MTILKNLLTLSLFFLGMCMLSFELERTAADRSEDDSSSYYTNSLGPGSEDEHLVDKLFDANPSSRTSSGSLISGQRKVGSFITPKLQSWLKVLSLAKNSVANSQKGQRKGTDYDDVSKIEKYLHTNRKENGTHIEENTGFHMEATKPPFLSVKVASQEVKVNKKGNQNLHNLTLSASEKTYGRTPNDLLESIVLPSVGDLEHEHADNVKVDRKDNSSHNYDNVQNGKELMNAPRSSVQNDDKMKKLMEELVHVDSDVVSMKEVTGKALGEIRSSVKGLLDKTSHMHMLNELEVGHLVNITLEAAKFSVQKLCIEPLEKQLHVPSWSEWNEWGKCTLTCGGGGYRLRHRNCQADSQRRCLGNDFDISPCATNICPAIWLTWGRWSRCSSSCDHGLQVRTRTCLTSEIKVRCHGATAEVKDCFFRECQSSEIHHSGRNGNKPQDEMKQYFGGKGHKVTMLDVGKVPPSNSKHVPKWSTWSGWTVCEQCGIGSRERRRICMNSTALTPLDASQCPGEDVDVSTCANSACPIEKEFPNAPHVLEGEAVEIRCDIPLGESPEKVYWITPTNQQISHHTRNSRLHMYGTSLLVDAARFVDQGKYRCVMLFPNNVHHVHQAPLIVETCKDRPCLHNGQCLTTDDPDFENFSHYKCKCSGKYTGSFCDKGILKPNKLVGPVIITLVSILFGVGLVIFLVKRSRYKARRDKEQNQWKKQGSLKRDMADQTVGNTSVVSQDDSFVEITAEDYKSLDEFDLPQDKQMGECDGHTSDGFEESFLKYPSPRQKYESPRPRPNFERESEDNGYVNMSVKHGSSGKTKRIKFNDETAEEVIYENMGYDGVPIYENVPGSEELHLSTPEANNTVTLKSKGRGKKGKSSPEDAIDYVAEQLTYHCINEIQKEALKYGKPFKLSQNKLTQTTDTTNTLTPFSRNIKNNSSQAPESQGSRNDPRTQFGLNQDTFKRSTAEKMAGKTVKPGESPRPSSKLKAFTFPKSMPVMDKEQEAEFLRHFDKSFIPETHSPSTSTPKKRETLPAKDIIMPRDIVESRAEIAGNVLTVCNVKKNLSKELMVVTSENVIGQQEEADMDKGKGNSSSNNGRSNIPEVPSECGRSSGTTYLTPYSPSDSSYSRKDSFLSMNSSLRTLPDLDGTVSFPKLSPSKTSPAPAISEEFSSCRGEYWNGPFYQEQGTEGSVYLSDNHYTPDASEVWYSQGSTHQSSDVEYVDTDNDDGEDHDDDSDGDNVDEGVDNNSDTSISDTATERNIALRYIAHPDRSRRWNDN